MHVDCLLAKILTHPIHKHSLLPVIEVTPIPYVTLRNTADVDTLVVPRADDGASSVIRIPVPLPIGSSLHNTVYVHKLE